ncbi:MAG: GNAT family N-acetyltransferase, partial [Gemmatimonadota bacterium]
MSLTKSSAIGAANRMDLRALASEDDYEACMRLQRDIWGDDVRETVPAAIMQVAQKVGGVAAGAFEPTGELAGFVFGITGLVDGVPAHWSHLLAVRSDLRNRGVGRALKQYQAERLRKIGIDTIYWTFDPLESRNAHLNLNRLGAAVIEYVPHMYGRRALAKTDAVIGTDRFIV